MNMREEVLIEELGRWFRYYRDRNATYSETDTRLMDAFVTYENSKYSENGLAETPSLTTLLTTLITTLTKLIEVFTTKQAMVDSTSCLKPPVDVQCPCGRWHQPSPKDEYFCNNGPQHCVCLQEHLRLKHSDQPQSTDLRGKQHP